MFKNLLTIAVIAGLAYGAYTVYEKFLKNGPASKTHSAQQVTTGMVSFVCPTDIEAFDPAAPDKTLGYFKKGTEIKVGSESGVQGMKAVAYQPPSGELVQALCKTTDLSAEKAAAAPAPATAALAPTPAATLPAGKPTVAPLNQGLAIAGKKPGVGSWLGNGKMTIKQSGCGTSACSPNTKKLGSTSGPAPLPTPASTTADATSSDTASQPTASDLQKPQNSSP